MAHELISPNLHVVLIHYPLGLLIAGILIEVFGFLWPRSSFRVAGRWMILLGALSAVPATFSGIYALRDVAARGNPMGEAPWVDVKAASPQLSDPVIWQVMRNHVLYQSIATGLCALAVVVWLGSSDRARKSLHIPLLGVLVLGMAIAIRGAHHGGEAVFLHGVAVDLDKTNAGSTGSVTKDGSHRSWEELLPPVELHTVAAGMAVAVALAAIGLSFRKINASYDMADDRRPIRPRDETMAENGGPRTPPSSVSMVRSFNPDIEVEVNPFAPAARFWLLTCLVGLMTAAGGLYVSHADEIKTRTNPFKAVWREIDPRVDHHVNRLFTHVTAGTIIVVTPLVLAGLARFAPRRRFWLSLFTLILVLAVSAQIWFGVLLMFDTPAGSLARFRPSETAAPTTSPAVVSMR